MRLFLWLLHAGMTCPSWSTWACVWRSPSDSMSPSTLSSVLPLKTCTWMDTSSPKEPMCPSTSTSCSITHTSGKTMMWDVHSLLLIILFDVIIVLFANAKIQKKQNKTTRRLYLLKEWIHTINAIFRVYVIDHSAKANLFILCFRSSFLRDLLPTMLTKWTAFSLCLFQLGQGKIYYKRSSRNYKRIFPLDLKSFKALDTMP